MEDTAPKDTTTLSVHPTSLYSRDAEFKDAITKSSFGFTQITRINDGGSTYNCVTLIDDSHEYAEGQPANLQPRDLQTKFEDFHNGIDNDHYFNWRWFDDDQGNSVRVLTIEDFSNEDLPDSNG